MDSLFFAIKDFGITTALVLLMQVNVGGERLEYKVADAIRGSVITNTVAGSAEGAVKLIRNTWNKISGSLGTKFTNAVHSDNRPGKRVQTEVDWERSKEYLSQKTQSTKETVREFLKKEGIVKEKPVKQASPSIEEMNIETLEN